MALDMSQIERIRDLRALGYSPSEIRRETGYSYPTIRKYLAIDDFSPKRPGARTGRPSLLDGLEGDIEEMLESDRHCYHKQRHTARRVYDRLVAEKGYAGSYSTVQRKVREMRRAMRQPAKDGYVRLHWEPGTMQVDFGQADFDYAFGGSADGDRVRMHFLSMSFPYSNDARCEVFGDEKDVCVCQGLQDAFDMIGGVPRVVVLDNATEAGRRWHDVVTESKLFRRFRLHYGFEARFCNPSSGNEKGNVENKVGFIRRNYMVPAPKVGDLRDYNEALNAALGDRSRREAHYKKGLTWADLFEADKAALLPLPDKDFDVVRWTACRTDGYGRVSLDGGRHVYLASPELANVALTVGVRAFTVEIDGPDGAPIRGYRRRTGDFFTCDEDPLALIDLLAAKARAFGSSSVSAMFSEACRSHFGSMTRSELSDQIRVMGKLMRSYGAEVAVGAFEEALGITGATRAPDVEMTAARMAAGGRRTDPSVERGTKMIEYDSLITARRHAHG